MSILLPPSSGQELVIITGFNTLLLQFMLFSTYSVVYFGTMYMYSTRSSAKCRIVIAAISLSYLISTIQTSVRWYLVKRSFIDSGGTQNTVIVTFVAGPGWPNLVKDISYFIVGGVADGLLIWRCFQIWNGSFRAISLPLLFAVGAIGVYASIVVITFTTKLYTLASVTQDSQLLDILTGVLLFLDLASTLATTILISYRINSFAKRNPFRNSRSRFKRIVEILVQSAAAYSLVIIAYAIASIIPTDTLESVNAARSYTSIFYFFTAGIAPTIMVARVLTMADGRQEILEISHSSLQFDHTPV
ncbi:hypothetical protein CPB84DRAFT_1850022 [Gymnopilus junonius]|uniref:Uncharacterized protein n=1 Tax=Gymnopilus junonius TaxID=109634 RepID=A0A9P5TJ19_GYMJU|nr:hypothetical protein CPB84DRAFT_1850022 [Gymnopilus junonius]